MDDEFILKCSFYRSHGLHNFDDIRSLNHEEKVSGFAICVDCSKQVPIELTRCDKCGLGWTDLNEVLTAVELNDVLQPIALTMEMPCFICEPWVKEHQKNFRYPFIEMP